jgi:hypothetical protein
MSFRPGRGKIPEGRTRDIEDGLGAVVDEVESLRMRLDRLTVGGSLGGGVQSILNALPGGGPAPAATLNGDTVGPAGANTTEKLHNLPVEEPDAADDEKWLKYQHATPGYEWSHIDRLQNFPIPAPVAGDDEKFIRYQHGTPAFEYAFVVLAGDVTGTNPVTVVAAIQGFPVSTTDPAAGEVLRYDGTQYAPSGGRSALTFPADADRTVTAAEALADLIDFTSGGTTLTATRAVVLPNWPGKRWTVRNNSPGGQSIMPKTAAGVGPTIATGKYALVQHDGTDILRITPDT